MAVYVVMTLGAFLCVLRMRDAEGRPVEEHRTACRACRRRGPGFAAALAIFMFSLAGIPPLFGFWPKLLVFSAAVRAGYVALAVAGILGTVIGAFYYLKIVKMMYFDEPAPPYARVRQPVQGVLILLAALVVSPLGYLLIGPLGALTDRAAGSAVLSRIRIVERTGSTNADLIADASRAGRRVAGRAGADRGQGRQGREWVSAPAISTAARLSGCAATIRQRRPCRLSPGWRWIEAVDAGRCRAVLDAQMAQRSDARRQEARRHPARAERATAL